MLAKIQAAIADHRLIAPGDHVIAAVSGGADSVALVRALSTLRDPFAFSLSLLHVHHGIRGAAADADADRIRELADANGVALDIHRTDVPAQARARGVSLEMAARDARLSAYRDVAGARSAAGVAVGHTRNDRTETLLLRLLRGSGITGMSGLRSCRTVRGVRLIRPMLDCSRKDVEVFLQDLGQAWSDDESNHDDQFLRNRVRHELLPMLRERFSPGVEESLYRATCLMEQDDIYLTELAQHALGRCRDAEGMHAGKLCEESPALVGRMLHQWLIEEGMAGDVLNAALVDRVRDLAESSCGSASVPLPGGGTVRREYEFLRVCSDAVAPAAGPFQYSVCVPGRKYLEACGLSVILGIEPVTDPRCPGRLGEWPAEACLSLNRVGDGPVTFRSRRPGDRFRPLGLGGTVKLKDVLIDAKVPVARRDRIPVCLCGDEIIWIPGYRVADGWEVGPGDQRCVRLRVEVAGG